MSEQKEDESGILEQAAAKMGVKAGKHLARYAVNNLWRLVYTDDGQVRLPEVHEWLKMHVQNADQLTNDDIAAALENAGEKYLDLNVVDELLAGIDNRWLRGGVNAGISFGSRVVKHFPQFTTEFQEKKDTLILDFLRTDPQTRDTYKILEGKPKLTKFVTEAVMTKLGIPLEKAAASVVPPPAGVG